MITCCRYCVPPKRSPICHCYCKEYKIEKEAHEAEKKEIQKQKDINNLFSQKMVEQRVRKVKKKNQKKLKNYN